MSIELFLVLLGSVVVLALAGVFVFCAYGFLHDLREDRRERRWRAAHG